MRRLSEGMMKSVKDFLKAKEQLMFSEHLNSPAQKALVAWTLFLRDIYLFRNSEQHEARLCLLSDKLVEFC